MLPPNLRRFQLVMAGCSLVAMTVAAVLTATPLNVADRSNPVLVCTCFGIANAVVSVAGRMLHKIIGVLGGAAAVTGFVGYLAAAAIACVAFIVAAAAMLITLLLAIAAPQGGRRRRTGRS